MKFCGHVPTYRTTKLHTSSAGIMSLWNSHLYSGRSRWPCGVRRGSAATRLPGLRVRIPLRHWMFVCCKCCALSSRDLCEELITNPEESYGLQYVVMCGIEISRMRTSWPALGRSARKKKSRGMGLKFLSGYPEKCFVVFLILSRKIPW